MWSQRVQLRIWSQSYCERVELSERCYTVSNWKADSESTLLTICRDENILLRALSTQVMLGKIVKKTDKTEAAKGKK